MREAILHVGKPHGLAESPIKIWFCGQVYVLHLSCHFVGLCPLVHIEEGYPCSIAGGIAHGKDIIMVGSRK